VECLQVGRGETCATKLDVGLTDQTLSCAARAHVATAERHATRLHVRRAMRVACRRPGFDFTRRLGRRAEAGPRQLLRRVRPPAKAALSYSGLKLERLRCFAYGGRETSPARPTLLDGEKFQNNG